MEARRECLRRDRAEGAPVQNPVNRHETQKSSSGVTLVGGESISCHPF